MKKSTFLFLICLFNTVSVWPQYFGSAINLDGLDDYCIVPHHESLNPGNGSWSVALWVKAANKNQVSPFVMKRLTTDPYTQYSYGFAMDDPHNPVAGKRIRVNHIDNAGLSERSGHTSGEYIDGNWHHYAIVADQEENGMVIFVDGEPVEFVSLYYFGEWPEVSNVSDLIIARRGPGQTLEGPMDELSIWNRALKQEQVQQIMADTLSPAYYHSADSGLVAYYRFDAFEDLGIGADGPDDFRDLSVWLNHADSEGNPGLISSGIPVGVQYHLLQPELLIYPNPAKDRINISLPFHNSQAATLSLISLYGSTIKSAIIPAGQAIYTLDISDLPSGVYLAKISSIEAANTGKVVKW